MPLYSYQCNDHGLVEEFRPVERRDDPCPHCGAKMARLIEMPAVTASGMTQVERDGLTDSAMRHKKWLETPEVQADIASGRKEIKLQGPKELQPTMPAKRSY